MRILHVVPTYLPAVRYGGPIYSVHGLCKSLAEAGNEVHVFTTNVDGPDDSPVPLGRQVDLEGIQVWYFPSNHLRRLYYSPAMGRALAQRIDEFDLVHLHSVFLWPTWAAARKARAAGVPYIVSPRGMLDRRLIQRKSYWLKSAWIALIERQNLEAAAGVHVTSNLEARELDRFHFRLRAVFTVPNGADEPEPLATAEVSEDISRLTQKQPLILSLGRINWKKGLDRLIRALPEVPAAHLAVVGNDEENYLPTLKALIQEHDLDQRATLIPRRVGGSDKEALFAAASVFVLPSLSENFGNVVLEAMLRGCPVIVSRDVGAADIVEKAGAGLIFDGTKQDLATALSTLCTNPTLRQEMGAAGKRETEAHFLWPKVAEQMASHYRDILAARDAPERNSTLANGKPV